MNSNSLGLANPRMPHPTAIGSSAHEVRILIAERNRSQLTALTVDFPSDLPVEIEYEDDLASVAHLAVGNVFDVIVIGRSLIGQRLNARFIEELAECSHTTPILVMADFVPELAGEVSPGTIRVVSPQRLTASVLLREIRYTLEMHVLNQQFHDQRRRLECLNDMFGHMLERMPYPVVITDTEGYICCMNHAAEAIWGSNPELALGRQILREPRDGMMEMVCFGPELIPIEASAILIDWLGARYFLVTLSQGH